MYIYHPFAETAIIQLSLPFKHYNVRMLEALKGNLKHEGNHKYQTIFAFAIYKKLCELVAPAKFRVTSSNVNCNAGYIIITFYVGPKKPLINGIVSKINGFKADDIKNYYTQYLQLFGEKFNKDIFDCCFNELVSTWNPHLVVISKNKLNQKDTNKLVASLVKPAKKVCKKSPPDSEVVPTKYTKLPIKDKHLSKVIESYINSRGFLTYIDDDVYILSPNMNRINSNIQIDKFARAFAKFKTDIGDQVKYNSMDSIPGPMLSKIKITSIPALSAEIKKNLK